MKFCKMRCKKIDNIPFFFKLGNFKIKRNFYSIYWYTLYQLAVFFYEYRIKDYTLETKTENYIKKWISLVRVIIYFKCSIIPVREKKSWDSRFSVYLIPHMRRCKGKRTSYMYTHSVHFIIMLLLYNYITYIMYFIFFFFYKASDFRFWKKIPLL